MYNVKSSLALVCPITNQAKGYPFEVPVPTGHGTTGVILADHIKSVDWKVRGATERGGVRERRSKRSEPESRRSSVIKVEFGVFSLATFFPRWRFPLQLVGEIDFSYASLSRGRIPVQ